MADYFATTGIGTVPMAAALRGTSQAWNNGDHKTPSRFQTYSREGVWDLKRWSTAVDNGLYLEGNWRVDFVRSGARVAAIDDASNEVSLAAIVNGGSELQYRCHLVLELSFEIAERGIPPGK